MRSRAPEAAWAAFAAVNVAWMFASPRWETIPFHFAWVSLTLLYGFRVWGPGTTVAVTAALMGATAVAIVGTVITTGENFDEVFEVPLMAAMFAATVWHARRRLAAIEQVRRMASRAQRLLERQRDFVRDGSHELRTPIAVAQGHIELILAASTSSVVRADAEIVLDELHRLAGLSERLLLLAAAEHPDFLQCSSVDLETLLAGVFRRWSPTAHRHWTLSVGNTAPVSIDAPRVEVALDAILENAVRFTNEGDAIALSGRTERDVAVIEVADAGPGVPPEHQVRIFERFARVDHGRDRRAGGTGLGLAIARAVVEAHHGEIAYAPTPGGGATFRIRLPDSGPYVRIVDAYSAWSLPPQGAGEPAGVEPG